MNDFEKLIVRIQEVLDSTEDTSEDLINLKIALQQALDLHKKASDLKIVESLN